MMPTTRSNASDPWRSAIIVGQLPGVDCVIPLVLFRRRGGVPESIRFGRLELFNQDVYEVVAGQPRASEPFSSEFTESQLWHFLRVNEFLQRHSLPHRPDS